MQLLAGNSTAGTLTASQAKAHEIPRVLRLERDQLKRRVHRQQLNAVVPPAAVVRS
jgi:hypothetical protein